MLTIDGYASLTQFYAAARAAINERMNFRWQQRRQAWRDTLPPDHDFTSDAGPDRNTFFHHNMTCAAQYLVFDIFNVGTSKKGRRPQILKPDGTLLGVPTSIITPTWPIVSFQDSYSNERRLNQKNGQIGSLEQVFGLDTFQLDFWVDIFLTEQVFGAPSSSVATARKNLGKAISMINWDAGCLDLAARRSFLKAVDLMREAANLFAQTGFEPPASLSREGLGGDYERFKGEIKILEPFENCTLVAPLEWLQELNTSSSSGSQLASMEASRGDPRELIASLILSEELTKKAIKEKVIETFPSTSSRRFDAYWAAISHQMPAISKPGPKKKKQAHGQDS